jgi:dTDP-glucose 4,6-dehydratase
MRSLGWEPRVAFADGIRRTVDWYLANPSWWRPLKSGEFWEFYRRNYRRVTE